METNRHCWQLKILKMNFPLDNLDFCSKTEVFNTTTEKVSISWWTRMKNKMLAAINSYLSVYWYLYQNWLLCLFRNWTQRRCLCFFLFLGHAIYITSLVSAKKSGDSVFRTVCFVDQPPLRWEQCDRKQPLWLCLCWMRTVSVNCTRHFTLISLSFAIQFTTIFEEEKTIFVSPFYFIIISKNSFYRFFSSKSVTIKHQLCRVN